MQEGSKFNKNIYYIFDIKKRLKKGTDISIRTKREKFSHIKKK